jgi:hypothetical protein
MKQSLQKACQETSTCHEATEAYTEKIQPDPRMMQSIAERQEVPKEEAAVMLVGGRRKRCREWNLAAECHQELKERTWGYCGSWKTVTVAARRMTCSAAVARRKEHGLHRLGKDDMAPRTPKGRTSRMKRWMGPECKIRIKDPYTRQQLHLKIERISEEFDKKTLELEFVRRAREMDDGENLN